MKRGGRIERRTRLRSDPETTRRWRDRTRAPLPKLASKRRAGKRWWAEQSLRCRIRDGRRCRRCGAFEGAAGLGAAHVIPLGSRGTRFDAELDLNRLSNLVTLCHTGLDCHGGHDQRGEWSWVDIGVTPDPDLVARYGYVERKDIGRPADT